VKRVKKGRGSQKKCRSIDFNSIFQYISQEQQNPVSGERLWILRLPHVTHSLIGRGSLIRWRASFVNVKGILSAPQLRPPTIALADGNYNSQTTTTSVTTSSLSKWAQSSENICPGWRSNHRKYI